MRRRYDVSSARWRKAEDGEGFRPLHVEEGTLLLPAGTNTVRVEMYTSESEVVRELEEWYRQEGGVELRLQLKEREEAEMLSGTLGFDGPRRPGLEYVRVEGSADELSFGAG